MATSGIGSLNFGGLATGLDTGTLIEAIMRVERRPLERLESQQVLLNQKKSAYDEMRSKLSSFLTTLRDLSAERTFRARTTTVADETYFTATAAAGAETGLFSIEVFALAAADKVKSDGLAAADQGLVSDGTITIQSGDEDVITVNVSQSSGNNTLNAIRDEINDADDGVQAAVIYDGSVYRLIVRSEETGLDNALTITDTTNLDLDDAGNEVTAAADSRIEVDGVEVTSSSNEVTDVIEGVTLNLLSLTSGTAVSLQVDDDTEEVVDSVQSLVSEYNDVIRFFNQQLDKDANGPLSSDGTSRRIHLNLQSLVTGGVEGIPVGGIRSLSSIGISFDGKTGEMSLDSGELREVLEDQFDDVADLFLDSGTPTDTRIRYVSSTTYTEPGEYAVEVTQAAERATVAGSNAIRALGLAADETLTITVGSDSTTASLTAGMDTDQVVDAVNSALRDDEVDAYAVNDGGTLRIYTIDYGSDADVSVQSSLADPGDGSQTGFDTTAATDTGVDVVGKIGGVDATGSGQLLTGDDDGDYAGLTVRVTATADDVTATGGDFGTISFAAGLTRDLISELTDLTRISEGPITSAKDVIDDRLKQISDDMTRLEERLAQREARLVRTFAEAERAISMLQAQQAQLSSFTAI